MDAVKRIYKSTELAKEKMQSNLGEEFRLKFNVMDFTAISEDTKYITEVNTNGTIVIPYPTAIQGQVFNMRIEKWTWHLYLDMKQIYNTTGVSGQGYINIDGANFTILPQVQDLPSLLRAHDLGGLIRSEDYTLVIKWKKTVHFDHNPPHIRQWLRKIGFGNMIDETFTAGSETVLNAYDVWIEPETIYNCVMESNNMRFPSYGDDGNQIILCQVYSEKPSGYKIAYNATDDTTAHQIYKQGDAIRLKIYHQRLNIPLNKLTLHRSPMYIEVRGRIVK